MLILRSKLGKPGSNYRDITYLGIIESLSMTPGPAQSSSTARGDRSSTSSRAQFIVFSNRISPHVYDTKAHLQMGSPNVVFCHHAYIRRQAGGRTGGRAGGQAGGQAGLLTSVQAARTQACQTRAPPRAHGRPLPGAARRGPWPPPPPAQPLGREVHTRLGSRDLRGTRFSQ